ncbi:MAG: hypothetical protein GOVbin7744_9 [Prokaryotic dsDNA virus sp.]|nr:MAG: hypothetical protein GOVbin7744_9 [Prokaryotic dsDNA virus sp.]|tara:strand:+ start:523 stop:783 length:261 start_codon:yes stop_codon:yes gene_type:complete
MRIKFAGRAVEGVKNVVGPIRFYGFISHLDLISQSRCVFVKGVENYQKWQSRSKIYNDKGYIVLHCRMRPLETLISWSFKNKNIGA